MINKIPENIKNVYKLSIIITVIILIFGIIFNKPELYFAFFVGSIASMIVIYMLTLEVYNIVYVKEKFQGRNPFSYLMRMGVFILGLLFVVYVSKKYYPNLVRNNIISTGIGFLNFKISLFLNEKLKIIKNKK